MSFEATIHQVQTTILRELLFMPEATFSQLQKRTNLDSDHFKFHVKRLVELDYVAKVADKYRLTPKGKEYANKLDTDQNTIERQPKTSVIVFLQDADGKVLVQERLKHPYYGFWGYLGGKIRWGETILQAAARELHEESGLGAESFTYRGVYHEHVASSETGELLEDKIFHVVAGHLPTGKLVEQFEGGRNAWLTIDQLRAKDKKYMSAEVETEIGLGNVSFVERTDMYTKEEF